MNELRQNFIDGMSRAAATVCIVATDGKAGKAGVTVSAMSSVSADTLNPTLLVCVNEASAAAGLIIENGTFSVNILRDNQVPVSDVFAGRYGHSREEKFSCASWTPGLSGSPLLEGALTNFDCRLVKNHKVGTHHVFMGEVQQVRDSGPGHALIYASRNYRAISNLPHPFGPSGYEQSPVRLACLNSVAQTILPDILLRHRVEHPQLPVEVWDSDQDEALLATLTGDAQIGLIYDRDVPDSLSKTRLATFRPYILLPDGHHLLAQREISLKTLADEPLILLDSPASRDYFLSVFQAADIKPRIGMSVRSFELVLSLVAAGLGYSILVTTPQTSVSFAGRSIHRRPIQGEIETIDLVMTEKKPPATNPAVVELRERICASFGCG